MSCEQDGGSAFPWGEHGTRLGGMTLRDYFAAKAMQSLIHGQNINSGPNGPNDNRRVAVCAYLMADAMLAAREVQS